MSVYHWLVVLVLLFAFLLHGERKGNTKFILVAAALMFCVYGLRDAYSVGNDSASSYKLEFESMEHTDKDELPGLSDWWHVEEENEDRSGHERNIAFTRLMKFVYDKTDGDYQAFIILISAFVMIAVAHFVRRYSPSPIQSVLYFFGLLYFSFMFSALKQSIAMAIILFSFDAVNDRKLIRFLLLVALASMFHFPAIVFLPAYWVANMQLGRTYLFFLAILFVLTYLFRDQLVKWMTDNYNTLIFEDSSMRFMANKVVIMLVIIVAALLIRPPEAGDKLYSSMLMLIGIAAVIQTFAGYNNTFERLADYYYQFAVVFIPMVFEDVKTKRQYLQPRALMLIRNYAPYFVCAFAIWRFLHVVGNDGTLNPYQFYFQAEDTAKTLFTGRFL